MKNNKNNKMELRVVDGKIVSVPAENTAAVNKTGLSITRHKARKCHICTNRHYCLVNKARFIVTFSSIYFSPIFLLS